MKEPICEVERVAQNNDQCGYNRILTKGLKSLRNFGLEPVAHACNPSYSGGRDQEDLSSKTAWANSLQDPNFEKTHHKKGLVEWLKMQDLSSSPSTSNTKKK
jgi:hypothetical protein